MKEVQPNANWFPFEENTYTSDYRHNWVLVRRNQPHDPTFLHCPMPRRGDGEHERNAALIMTYFHPFTLNPGWHEEHVPFLGRMCGQLDSWHMSMMQWFDGRILSEESRRYIQNFLVVTRVRPEDDNAEENSDDLLSDDLELRKPFLESRRLCLGCAQGCMELAVAPDLLMRIEVHLAAARVTVGGHL